jgi:hypothetical protein
MRRIADVHEVADQHVLLDDDLTHDAELAAATDAYAVTEDEPRCDVVEDRLDGHPHVLEDDHAVANLNELRSRNSRRRNHERAPELAPGVRRRRDRCPHERAS